MRTLKLFWWAPVKSVRLLKPELETNLRAWMSLGVGTRRAFRNFGDEISPIVIQKMSGRRVEWSSPQAAEIVSVGSILELAGRYASSAAVWGTGLRGEPDSLTAERFRANLGPILAVRGPKTRAALALDPETPLGDPGLLASRLVERQGPRSGKMVFIPHFTTWNSREGRILLSKARERGFDVVPPSLPPMAVIEAVRRASFVLSSSLHGVVVAHSVGVPVRLLNVGGRPGREPDWKFVDYFSSIRAEYEVEAWSIFDDPQAIRRAVEKANALTKPIQHTADELGSNLVDILRDAIC